MIPLISTDSDSKHSELTDSIQLLTKAFNNCYKYNVVNLFQDTLQKRW